jgi:N6-adenosine-specific RNA methylase IME4
MRATRSDLTPRRLLLADPPWKHADALGRRGAQANYRCMSTDEIARFPLPPLADDCLLLLWRLSSMAEDALFVARAWGFTIKSEIVWRKLTATGKPFFGMGRYVRNCHETMLLGTRGRFRVDSHSIRSMFEAPVGEHSAKPDLQYAIAEELCVEGPYAELFARRSRRGWLSIGDQLPLTQIAADSRQLELLEIAQ